MSGKKIVGRKTFALRLTRSELVHLRDLFNVLLPTELKTTISHALAQVEERPMLEIRLWGKVSAACAEADIPLDETAPDFAVVATASPQMSVFQIARESAEYEADDGEEVADE